MSDSAGTSGRIRTTSLGRDDVGDITCDADDVACDVEENDDVELSDVPSDAVLREKPYQCCQTLFEKKCTLRAKKVYIES